MAFDPVRLGVVSPGRWAHKLLDSIRDSAKITVAGIASRQPANAEAFASEYGGTVYADYSSLLRDPQIEAVMLATPDHLHHEQAIAAFDAGKHVFVEKPIAHRIDLAEAMVRRRDETGLVLSVGMPLRRNGAALAVKRWIDEGSLGDLVLVAVNHGSPGIQNREEGSWWLSPECVPGGVLDQMGVHYGDLLPFWFGPVRSVMGTYRRNPALGGYVDSAVGVFTFESGLIASYSAQVASAYVSNCIIFGTKAAVHYNRAGQELLWEDLLPPAEAKEKGPQIREIEAPEPLPFSGALREELEDFADAVRHGTRPKVGGEEGVAALRLVRAVMQAHEESRPVLIAR